MIDFKNEVEKIKDEMLQDLKDLCLIDSTMDLSTAKDQAPFGEKCRQALDKMIEIGKRDGYITDDCDGYAGSIDIGEGESVLGILGHLDVVPANLTGWVHPQYDATLDNGILYGRGVADDKGPLLAAYYAAKIVNKLDFERKHKVRIIFGCNEENGSKCLEYYFKHRPYPQLGFTPDAEFPVIYGEKGIARVSYDGKINDSDVVSLHGGTVINIVPGETKVVLKKDLGQEFHQYLEDHQYTGSYKKVENGYEYLLKGKSAHASTPEKGINSISNLVHFVNKYVEDPFIDYLDKHFYQDVHGEKLLGKKFVGEMGETTSNLAIVHYENNQAHFEVDMRLPHELKKEELIHRLNDHLPELFVYELDYTAPLFVDSSSELVQTLHQSYVTFTGDTTNKPQCIGGGTYAKEMPNCVAFGCEFPGKDHAMHQDDEHIALDDLLLSTAIYAKAIYDLIKK